MSEESRNSDPPPTGADREYVKSLVVENHSMKSKLTQTQTKLDAAVDALGKIEVIAEQIDFMGITDDPCDVDDKTGDIEMLAMETLKEIKK